MVLDKYRGVLQVRAFWQNVRMELQIDDDDDHEDIVPVEVSTKPWDATARSPNVKRRRDRRSYIVKRTTKV
jgi:hypothetical protein